MREPEWSDVWHLAMTVVGRASIEIQLLVWLVALLMVALFVEGIRTTFFPRAASHAKPRESKSSPMISDAAQRLLAAQARHLRKRATAPRARIKPSLPGIYRRPFYFERPVYDVLQEIPQSGNDETMTPHGGSHLRIAS